MIHLFHQWSKWSKPKWGKFDINRVTYWGETVAYEEEREYQYRNCIKCGEHQERLV